LLALCVVVVAPASALADCGTDIIDDYVSDGSVNGSYSQACYRSALKKIPTDVEIYTDARASIAAAMNRSAAESDASPSQVVPPATTSPAKPQAKPKTTPPATTTDEVQTVDEGPPVAPATTDSGLVGEALNAIGPKHADEVPLPVIVLGSLAAILILAGAGGFIAQRRGNRRDGGMPPATSVEGSDPKLAR
jgi:hypothetical protein